MKLELPRSRAGTPGRRSPKGRAATLPEQWEELPRSASARGPASSPRERPARDESTFKARRLSFVGVSLTDVWEAIQEEEPFLDWMPERLGRDRLWKDLFSLGKELDVMVSLG